MSTESEPTELVTGAEIARRAGFSRARAHQLAARPDFPRPLGRIGQAKVWRWDEIREWIATAGRPPSVEILSWTDPEIARRRNVWYQTRFGDRHLEPTTDYSVALAQAEQLCDEFDTGLIDRSDKGSGFLLSTIRRA